MKAALPPTDGLPIPDSFPIKVAIIYEDFESGRHAGWFADRLAEQLGASCPLAESMWRTDLLDCPSIAEDAARAASGCDYLIISFRGICLLPFAARQWIETQLEALGGKNAGLIFLPDSRRGKWRVLEATRQYLRSVCAAHGVAFFSHAAMPPAETAAPAEERWEEPAFGSRVCLPYLLPA